MGKTYFEEITKSPEALAKWAYEVLADTSGAMARMLLITTPREEVEKNIVELLQSEVANED